MATDKPKGRPTKVLMRLWRYLRRYRWIIISASLLSVLSNVLGLVSPLFPLFYNTTDEVRGLAASLIRVVALFMPMHAFIHASYFTLRSGGRTVITFLFDSVFIWAFSLPVVFVLSRFSTLPIIPLYFTGQFLEIVKCVIGFILVKKGVWIQNIVSEEKTVC